MTTTGLGLDLERTVIHDILTDPSHSRRLDPEDFADIRRQSIFRAIKRVLEAGPLDYQLLQRELSQDREASAELHDIAIEFMFAPSWGAARHVDLLLEDSTRRKLAQEGQKITEAAGTTPDPRSFVLEAGKGLQGALRVDLDTGIDVGAALLMDHDAVSSHWDREARSMIGVPTSLPVLDRATLGYRKGDLVLLGGRPGAGKTALAIQTAIVAGQAGKRVSFLSLEMGRESLLNRMIARLSGVDSRLLERGGLAPIYLERAVRAQGDLSNLPIHLVTSKKSRPSDLDAIARARPCDLFIVDYLQLMEGDGKHESHRLEVSSISRDLKQIAMDRGIPILALCQLKRTNSDVPDIGDLRESGALEADADTVIFLYPGEGERSINLKIGKQRNGPVGAFELIYQKETGEFRDRT